ncbi:MAG: DUF4190 domain-containing protein [Planctomycetota bacterium]|jgi:hypothetical protein
MAEPSYEGAYGAPARNSDLALYSLIAGILTWVMFPFVGAIAAIILGHMSLGEIRRSEGQLGGKGMAVGGLLLGYSQIVLSILIVGLVILGSLFFFVRAEEMKVNAEEAAMAAEQDRAALQTTEPGLEDADVIPPSDEGEDFISGEEKTAPRDRETGDENTQKDR